MSLRDEDGLQEPRRSSFQAKALLRLMICLTAAAPGSCGFDTTSLASVSKTQPDVTPQPPNIPPG
jgi:hypothetical protein